MRVISAFQQRVKNFIQFVSWKNLRVESVMAEENKPKAKIFLSDLHIGEGDKENSADDFTKKKEELFVELLKYLTIKVKKGSELILLGDIFDLIEQDVRKPDGSPDFEQALKNAMNAHKDFVEELKNWLKEENKIFYITGNHDHAIRHPEVANLLAERLFADIASTKWGTFVIDDWYISKNFKIYAEHGHRFDIQNSHLGTDDCFGDIIVRDLLRPLEIGDKRFLTVAEGDESPLKLIDNVRPRGRLVDYLKKLVGKGALTQKEEDKIKDTILELYKQSPDSGWAIKAVLDNSILRSLLITDDKLRKKLNDTYLPYRDYAKTMIQEKGLQMRDLSFMPRFLIMGHTHFFDWKNILVSKPEHTAEYINLASWLDTIHMDEDGNVGDAYEGCPYLIFTKDGDEPVKRTLMDADGGNMITKEKIKELQDQNKIEKNEEMYMR